MLTPKRLVLTSPRAKKLLWAAVKGNQSLVIVGGSTARRIPSAPGLRRFMGAPGRHVTVEIVPEIRLGARARRWDP